MTKIKRITGKWAWCLLGSVFLFTLAVPAFSAETVVDSKGRKINVDKPFIRIISLYGAHTENLLAMGLCSSIIGVNDEEDDEKDQTCKRPVFSYHDGPEKFFAAKPDLVLIRPMIDRAYPGLVSRLEQRGIKVMSFQPGDVNEMFEYWVNIGTLTGKKEKALSMVADFKKELSAVTERTKKIKSRKRVYFQAMHRQMKTFSKDSMAIFCLEKAGGINVAADAVSSRGTNIGIYGKEKILSHASEIDVFLAQNGRMNQADVNTIKNEPGFQIIKAVKEGKVYLIEESLVSRPTPKLIQGIKSISNVLYPELSQK